MFFSWVKKGFGFVSSKNGLFSWNILTKHVRFSERSTGKIELKKQKTTTNCLYQSQDSILFIVIKLSSIN